MTGSSITKCTLFAIALTLSLKTYSQCETWHGLPNINELENSFSIYRDFLRTEDYEEAFRHWETLYIACPALDGKSSKVYSDGVKIYIDKFNKNTDEKSRIEYVEILHRLAKELKECFPDAKAVALPEEILDFR